jgi:hypothetical protein
MEATAFEVQQNFQALRQNELIHGLVYPFGFFQDRDFQLFSRESPISPTSLSEQTLYLRIPEELIKNFAPASVVVERPRFKQQTFSAKPLSDEQVIQANQLAAEFEDQDIVRRLFRR